MLDVDCRPFKYNRDCETIIYCVDFLKLCFLKQSPRAGHCWNCNSQLVEINWRLVASDFLLLSLLLYRSLLVTYKSLSFLLNCFLSITCNLYLQSISISPAKVVKPQIRFLVATKDQSRAVLLYGFSLWTLDHCTNMSLLDSPLQNLRHYYGVSKYLPLILLLQ